MSLQAETVLPPALAAAWILRRLPAPGGIA